MQAASLRSQRVRMWAELDLDGDGRVTRAEVGAAKLPQAVTTLRPQGITADPTREQISAVLDKLVAVVMSQDADGNGVITLAEVFEAARAQLAFQSSASRTAIRSS